MSCKFTNWVWVDVTPQQAVAIMAFIRDVDIITKVKQGFCRDMYTKCKDRDIKGFYFGYHNYHGVLSHVEIWPAKPPHWDENQNATYSELCTQLKKQYGSSPKPEKINPFGIMGALGR